jgi:chaperonin GroEL (HSP60 family)
LNCFVEIGFDKFLQSSFVGAIAIGDLVKSTLGPKGMVSV